MTIHHCRTCNNYVEDVYFFFHGDHDIVPTEYKKDDLRRCLWCHTRHPFVLMEKIELNGVDGDGFGVQPVDEHRCQKCKKEQQEEIN